MLSVADRIAGGLLGLAAGDALGATLEFLDAAEVRRRHGRHTEIVGGGVFDWRAGQGTDDTDLAYAVARAYVDGYSLDRVAANFLAWFDSRPRDVGTLTAAALRLLHEGGDPRGTGGAVLALFDASGGAGNGALMRALPTALARADAATRRAEAAEIAAITHADPRCTGASVAFCELADALLTGLAPAEAVAAVVAAGTGGGAVLERLAGAAGRPMTALRPTGYVLDTLEVAAWALARPGPAEETLVEVVNLGGDADTTGAVAGALLGVRDGAGAFPERWLARLEYRGRLEACVAPLAALRRGEARP